MTNNTPSKKISPMEINQLIGQARHIIGLSIKQDIELLQNIADAEQDFLKRAEIVRLVATTKASCQADIEVATVRMLRSIGIEFYQAPIESGKPIAHTPQPPPAEPTPEELEAEAKAAAELEAERKKLAKGDA